MTPINLFEYLTPEAKNRLKTGNKAGSIIKFFELGYVPQGTQPPYAVWQHLTGAPYNHLTCPPDTEWHTLQVDLYTKEGREGGEILALIEQGLEAYGRVTGYRNFGYEPETKLFRSGFDIELVNYRRS